MYFQSLLAECISSHRWLNVFPVTAMLLTSHLYSPKYMNLYIN